MIQIRARAFWGVAAGAAVATGFTVWVTLLRLSRGTVPFDTVGTTYPMTLAVYYVTLPFAGAIVGLLFPIRRSAVGAMALGFLFLFPMYVGFTIVMVPRHEWLNPLRVALTLWGSIVAGAVLGLWVWKDDWRRTGSGRG